MKNTTTGVTSLIRAGFRAGQLTRADANRFGSRLRGGESTLTSLRADVERARGRTDRQFNADNA